ncbi:hypothetical protein BJ742DRAFT_809439 [Cladochytrium replicatum]|nr:hypothetical protein BJ742DRAFT_809439 [Cladochytrium replicatum]
MNLSRVGPLVLLLINSFALGASAALPPEFASNIPFRLEDGIRYLAQDWKSPCTPPLVLRTLNKTNCVPITSKRNIVQATWDPSTISRLVSGVPWEATFSLKLRCPRTYDSSQDDGYSPALDLNLMSTSSAENTTQLRFRVPYCSRLDERASAFMIVRPRNGGTEFLALEVKFHIITGNLHTPTENPFTDDLHIFSSIVRAFYNFEGFLGALVTVIILILFVPYNILVRRALYNKQQIYSAASRRLAMRPVPKSKKSSLIASFELIAKSIDPHVSGQILTERDVRALPISRVQFDRLVELAPGLKAFGTNITPQPEQTKSDDIRDVGSGNVPGSLIRTLTTRHLSPYQLLPSRLLRIGSQALVLGWKGRLILLPSWMSFSSAIRYIYVVQVVLVLLLIFLLYITWAVMSILADGLLTIQFPGFLDFARGGYSFALGMWWLPGLLGLIRLTVFGDANASKEKGGWQKMRAIAPPVAEEFMFSYNWDPRFMNDIRSIARALWEMDIGVWIDWVKIQSGDTVWYTVRKAARDVNTMVIFLTPKYLESMNCCHELYQSLCFPEKVHFHVLEWDETVDKFLRFMIQEVGISADRITAHPYKASKLGRRASEAKKQSTDAVHKLGRNGRGYLDLCAALTAYVQREGDVYDIWWWLRNASPTSSVPDDATTPPAVERYNFRLLTPWNLDWHIPEGSIRFGNLWISGGATKMGTRASAFPWLTVLLGLCAVTPLVDLVTFAMRWVHLDSAAASCIRDIDRTFRAGQNAPPDSPAGLTSGSILHALCVVPFFKLDQGTGPSSGLNYLIPVAWNRFDNYVNTTLRCSSFDRSFMYPWREIDEIVPCISNLEKYYVTAGLPTTIAVWPPFLALTILYLVVGSIDYRVLLDRTGITPPPLRALLVAGTLNQNRSSESDNADADNEAFTTGKRKTVRLTKSVRRKRVSSYEIDPELPAMVVESLSRMQGSPEGQFVPRVYVVVRGDKQNAICKTLQLYLETLGFHLPISDTHLDDLGFPSGQIPAAFQRAVWVNVYVISDFGFLQRLYAVRDRIGFNNCVFILDETKQFLAEIERHNLQPRPERVWLNSILFIVAKDKGVERPDVASNVFRNISAKSRSVLLHWSKKRFVGDIEKRALEFVSPDMGRPEPLQVQGMAPRKSARMNGESSNPIPPINTTRSPIDSIDGWDNVRSAIMDLSPGPILPQWDTTTSSLLQQRIASGTSVVTDSLNQPQ